ncbi:hypothetical protein P9222_16110 [Paenibacillus amylolyticus]|nr:hypothetical protein [Paenibacillus amylolyticus]WFR65337.1 hypothetical protein P9222_16110 [Paenibacillus amylolyticus]
MMGGGDFGRKCIWHSHDGRSWLADPRPLMGGNDATLSAEENISRPNAGVFMYKGSMWWLGMLSAYASGGVTTVARPAIAKISADFRQLLDKPSDIYFPALNWETTNMQSLMVSVMDGVVYVYYNTDSNIGVAYSVGV